MCKVYTPFQTKTTQKPTLWTRVGIYMAYTREFPPGGGGGQWDHFKYKFLISTCQSPTYHPTPQKAHLAPPQRISFCHPDSCLNPTIICFK